MSASVENERIREETLDLLTSMGVRLPTTTKLPLSELDERLSKALDCAQRHAALVRKKTKSQIKTMTPWRKPRSLSEAMHSASLEELFVDDIDVDGSPFGELRRTLLKLIGFFYEHTKMTEFCLEDPKMDRSVKITIDGIFMVTDDIPLIAVEFECGRVEDGDEKCVKSINTPEAHTLLRKLLELNADRIEGQQPEQGRADRKARFSYFLPLGPLSMKDIGSLTKNVGCVVCGATMINVCAGCHTVSYCGKECQRADWKRHKRACRTLETGTWLSVTYASGFATVINRTARSLDTPVGRAAGAGPNVHGESTFLVKVQITSHGGPAMLIYDRQRSLEGQFMRASDPVGFQRLEDVVKKGYIGLKVYVWAKRLGKCQLSICIDRIPDQSAISW